MCRISRSVVVIFGVMFLFRFDDAKIQTIFDIRNFLSHYFHFPAKKMLFSSFIGGCAEEATVRAQGDICKRRRSQLWREAHHAVTRSTAAPQHHLVYLHVKLIRKKKCKHKFYIILNII